MKTCRTCGISLRAAFFLFGWPWQKRVKPLKDAVDCIDLLPVKETL